MVSLYLDFTELTLAFLLFWRSFFYCTTLFRSNLLRRSTFRAFSDHKRDSLAFSKIVAFTIAFMNEGTRRIQSALSLTEHRL